MLLYTWRLRSLFAPCSGSLFSAPQDTSDDSTWGRTFGGLSSIELSHGKLVSGCNSRSLMVLCTKDCYTIVIDVHMTLFTSGNHLTHVYALISTAKDLFMLNVLYLINFAL